MKLHHSLTLILVCTLPAGMAWGAKAKKDGVPKEEAADATEEEVAEVSEEAPVEGEEAAPEGGTPPATATDKKPATVAPVVRSAMSLRLDERLVLSTSLGWAYIKPSIGTWQGFGVSSIDGAWRSSGKPDGKLFITARYTPYAGTWKVDERFYDATAHGVFVGTAWLFPVGKAALKAGLEAGYLRVFARPQDGGEADGKVKTGKASAGVVTEMQWTVLTKMRVGPVLRVNGGGFSTAHLGAAASYVF